jgi:hypothetical protein
MSEFWENYKKNVAEGAEKLSKPPKDVSQNILWLKAYVGERMEKEGLTRYVGDSSKEGTFGFAESYVNYLMHYAFEKGLESSAHSYKQATKSMDEGLTKIKDILDDLGYIDYNNDY